MCGASPLTRRGPRYAVLVPLTAVIVVVLAAVALLGTRTILSWFKEQTGQGAWHLTYEGTSNDGRGRPAKEVRYGHDDYAEQRYKEERAAPVRLPWRQEAVVDTGNEARVEVVPGTDGVVSCRILLDGVRVVAEGTSPAPGKPAVCRVTTPTTPEKWPCGNSVNTAACAAAFLPFLPASKTCWFSSRLRTHDPDVDLSDDGPALDDRWAQSDNNLCGLLPDSQNASHIAERFVRAMLPGRHRLEGNDPAPTLFRRAR
ncbi:hypothetical protein ACFH04_00570 [Streptomyces noboritoensis]|uniref:Uncharacterized protein n=1 Tax=Streptomyces noboritoensis TaxID=67337 RepID=A0ABV6T8Y5_9ACTN